MGPVCYTSAMRAIILGGAGDVGQHIVRTAATSSALDELVVADLDLSAATKAADAFDDHVTAQQVDVLDPNALAGALDGADIVVSCVGPYYRFGTLVLDAAIAAECGYIDICDDWEPTIALLERHQMAAEAGVTAIVGMGASPGISNILAAAAHAELETVDELHTIWGIGDPFGPQARTDDRGSLAALEHWLLQATGTIRAHRDGAMSEVAPLERREVILPGHGKIVTHTIGHPEPVTLPRTFPSVRNSSNLMNMPGPVIAVLRRTAREVDEGAVPLKDAAPLLERRLGEAGLLPKVAIWSRVILSTLVDRAKGRVWAPEICALAVGTVGGQSTAASAWLDGHIPGGVGGATGVPTAVALEMMAQGTVMTPGVFAPEAIIEPAAFFEALTPHVVREGSATGQLLRTATQSVIAPAG